MRKVHDMACGGRPVLIELEVRRFVCGNPDCVLRTFAEQVPALTQRHQHRMPLLRGVLEKVALALAGWAGWAGSRAAGTLGVTVSRSTLIRLIRALPDPGIGQGTAVGVDDFAKRKGHAYATILIDMDTHRPIDVLDGRDSASLTAWLAEHPEVQVICRDRTGAYAEAARIGAPHALEVADRFHLWMNLCAAVERCVARHRTCLAEPIATNHEMPSTEHALNNLGPADPTGRIADRAREHHALVHDLLGHGYALREIARHLGWGRHKVQRYARATTWQEMAKGHQKRRPSKLDPFKPYLHQRWDAGYTNALALYRELLELGYQGSYSTVSNHLATRRPGHQRLAPTPAPPSVRDVTGWITRRPDRLTTTQKEDLDSLLARCPELAAAETHVRTFATMLTTLTGHNLQAWITAASKSDLPGISAFALNLNRDLAAVTAGLTTPWNSGTVEGTVNRIKMLKRQMFGRANLDLLRKRILHPA
ncbi:ISL3 family transposase [Nonomuraea endophytica]|uniref:ISL3 family transposase n=1 Tax=Nonomuraea endophytica TaxID=714136 RepID=UPI0037C7C882